MAPKVKVTVSLNASIVRELADEGRRSGKSRSRVMEEVLEHWRRSRLEQKLKRGYQGMAREDQSTAQRSLPAAWEALTKSS